MQEPLIPCQVDKLGMHVHCVALAWSACETLARCLRLSSIDCAQVFGEHAASGPVNTAHLSVEPAQPGSQLSERINAVLRQLRSGRANYPSCFVVMQGARLSFKLFGKGFKWLAPAAACCDLAQSSSFMLVLQRQWP